MQQIIKSAKQHPLLISLLLCLSILWSCTKSTDENSDQTAFENEGVWVTTGDKTLLLEKMFDHLIFEENSDYEDAVIEVDTAQKFQSIDGFGYSLTGGSAFLIHQKLSESEREKLLQELFSDEGLGVSYLRISIGASDLDDRVFSYSDLKDGETDAELKHFSLSRDTVDLIPVLQQILKINPSIKIMGSPWSAPSWMKTNNYPKGGSLKPEYYEAYANYFVKYINAMADNGIHIDAITVQNEPENPKNKPSMVMTAEEQTDFVKNHLGPAFEKAGIRTKIIVFDHNCDHPEYPISILNDPDAKKYIDGSAFHMYLGEIEALSKVHYAHPDRNVYFTEQWTSGEGDFAGDLRWHTKELIIGATRNWSKNVLEWNLAADPEFNPHTDEGGCTICLGALTIGSSLTRNVSYYIIGHASKFVKPGSVRIASNMANGIANVAFLTPEGKIVLIAVNDSDQEKDFSIKFNNKISKVSLPAGAVGTFVWR